MIGGRCDGRNVALDVIFDDQTARFTSNCNDRMTRRGLRTDHKIGSTCRLVLIDSSPVGHINFDDLRGDFDCIGKGRPGIFTNFSAPTRLSTLYKPTLSLKSKTPFHTTVSWKGSEKVGRLITFENLSIGACFDLDNFTSSPSGDRKHQCLKIVTGVWFVYSQTSIKRSPSGLSQLTA